MPPAVVIGLAGWLLAASVAVTGLLAPAKLFAHPDWHDSGLRLLRDEYEVGVFFDRGRWFAEGGVPYTDEYAQEYPPLGVLFLTAPRLLTADPRVYEAVFALLMSALFGLLAGVTAELLGRLGRPRALLLLFLLPAFLYFSIWRYDLLPALLVAGALLAADRGRLSWAFLLMMSAALAKFYAALFVLPMIMFVAGRRWQPGQYRNLRNGAIAAAGLAVVAVVVVAVTAGPAAVASPVLFHLGRPFEVGSLGGLAFVGLMAAGLDAPSSWRVLAPVFSVLQFGFIVPLVIGGRVPDTRTLARACVFVLLPFMLFTRFFSPQWLIWLLPVQMLAAGRRETALLAVLGVIVYLQFPVAFGIDPYGWAYTVLTLVRSLILGLLWYIDVKALVRSGALKWPSLRRPAAPAAA